MRARKTSKYKSSRFKSLPPSNFQEKSQKDQDEDSDKHSRVSSKDSKPETKLEKSPDVNANAVPDPVPDTGVPTSLPLGTILVATPTPGFPPLPPVASFAVTTTMSATSITPFPSVLPHNVAASKDTASSQAPKHLPTVIIVLLSIGSALLLLGLLIAIRLCSRPAKRTCPTPSLPILQDEFSKSDEDGDEESLFGGKERLSERPGNQDLWTWTQYTQPSLNKPEPALSGPRSPLGLDATSEKVSPSKRNSVGHEEKEPYPFGLNGVSALESAPRTQPPAIQQMQSALTRAVNRVSALSMSIYPGSPDMTGIGIAVSGASPLTGDGMPALKRNPSKVSSRRMSRYNNRKSMLNVSTTFDRDQDDGDADHVLHEGLAYFATDVVDAGPGQSSAQTNSVQGRARVKAPYGAGQLPRSSAGASNVTASMYNPFEELNYVLPPLSPALKSNERRERDTKALANALGLSPQLTLYPDDSITLAGDDRGTYGQHGGHNYHNHHHHTRTRSEVVMTPTLEASARLGNLMLAEFGSGNSLATLTGPHATTTAAAATSGPSGADLARSHSVRKRADDKPPRVPSPPPLPSLAQMALAHTNPGDFDDYRSPTYSIYGLYEADRKSRGLSEAGY